MRDEYGRITPDFKAWEKLGWKLVEIHEQTYTFESKDSDAPWYWKTITAEYDTDLTDSHKPEYVVWVETFSMSDPAECGSYEDTFTNAEKEQIEKDVKNWEEEMAELDYQRSIEQVEHDELYEPTYDPETGAM